MNAHHPPTKLSVNVNKVATLRNTRPGLNIPDLAHLSRLVLRAGADGLTVHPRPDERHIRADDVAPLREIARQGGVEFNIEGNPFEGRFMQHCADVRPEQATLVPDSVEQATSDHGWPIAPNADRLRPLIAELRSLGCRVSLFMDWDSSEFEAARDVGADRVELYTEPYASRLAAGDSTAVDDFAAAARRAEAAGLGVNAGHDLNLANLRQLVQAAPSIAEVSIGHALIADALELGIEETVRRYKAALSA